MIFLLLGCTKSNVERDISSRHDRDIDVAAISTKLDITQGGEQLYNNESYPEVTINHPELDFVSKLFEKLTYNPLERDEQNIPLISQILKDKKIKSQDKDKLISLFVRMMKEKNMKLPLDRMDRDPIAIALNNCDEDAAIVLLPSASSIYCLDQSGQKVSYFKLVDSNPDDNYFVSALLLNAITREAKIEDISNLDMKLDSTKQAYKFKLNQILISLSESYEEMQKLGSEAKAVLLTTPEISNFFRENIKNAILLIEKFGLCYFTVPLLSGEDGVISSLNIDTFLTDYYRPIVFYVFLMKQLDSFNKIESHLSNKCSNIDHSEKETKKVIDSLLAEARTFSDDIKEFWDQHESVYYSSAEVSSHIDQANRQEYLTKLEQAQQRDEGTYDTDTAPKSMFQEMLQARLKTVKNKVPLTEGKSPKALTLQEEIAKQGGKAFKSGTLRPLPLKPIAQIEKDIESGSLSGLSKPIQQLSGNKEESIEAIELLLSTKDSNLKPYIETLVTNVISTIRGSRQLLDFKLQGYKHLSDEAKILFDVELTKQNVEYLKVAQYSDLVLKALCFSDNTNQLITLLNSVLQYYEPDGDEFKESLKVRKAIIDKLLLNVETLNAARAELNDNGREYIILYINQEMEKNEKMKKNKDIKELLKNLQGRK